MSTPPIIFKSKLPKTGTSIFALMSAMAQKYNAINLSQGFPDFEVHPKLKALVTKALEAGHNQYAPMPGLPALRRAIAEKVRKLYECDVDADEMVTVTSGGTEALYAAIAAVVHEGDEVIVFEPAYDSYVPAIRLNGGLPIAVSLEYPSFGINWEVVRARITANTRLIILNTPHNPTGSILRAEDMEELQRITRNTDILILSDEVYEHILFDRHEHQSVLRYPELLKRSFVVFSFGKTYHATGWKMGYCVASPRLSAEFRKVHQFIVFCSPTPLQHAFADFMQYEEEYLQLPEFYQAKRDYFNNLLAESRFTIRPSAGTYFQLAGYEAISDMDDMAFSEWLTREAGVASIPVSVFYSNREDHHLIRFCFAKSEKLLEKAANKLIRL